MTKRIVSVLLAVVLTIGVLPMELCTTAWAEEPDAAALPASTGSQADYGPAGRNLSSSEKALYLELKNGITRIATGQTDLARIDTNYNLNETSRKKVGNALRADLTWELYWCSGWYWPAFRSEHIWVFNIRSQYVNQNREQTVYFPYTNIRSKPSGVSGTPASSGSDYEKLRENMQKAASSSSWPTTTVQHFKYLCDQTAWNGDVEVSVVTGLKDGKLATGGWNIVRMEGTNYLVDGLGTFLRGGILRTTEDGSEVSYVVGKVAYEYDMNTMSVYNSRQLALSHIDYDPNPGKITLRSATAGDQSILVSWTPDAHASTYRVYRRIDGGSWWRIAEYVTGSYYRDSDVEPGVTYYYTVEGVNGAYRSPTKDETGVSATIPIKSPDDVTLTGATADSSGITVTWQPALNAKTYTVYRKTAGTGWSVIAKGVTATSYTDNTTAAGETYTYTVRGRTADGLQSKGFDKNGVTATVPKAADDVVLTAARISGQKIVVTWQPADGACSYMVYRKVTGTKKWTAIAKDVKGTSYTDSTVRAGVSYTYTVRGRGGDGVLSRHYDGVGVTAGIPANVTLVSATVEGTGITVTWQKAANAQTYTVYRKTPGAKKWTAIGKAIKGTQYRDAAVTPGITYTYTVRGVASDGRSLSPSYDGKGVSATVNKTPANVTLTAARAGADGITVTWCATNGAASYTVYRRIGTAKWTIIANGVTETSYTDSKAQAGVAYDYTARGRAASGTLSPGFDRTGVSSGIPADVTLTAARAGADSITITWQAAANATSYAVYRKSSGEGEWSCLAASVPGTRYVDTTAARDVDYVYTVRGVRDSALSLGCDENGKTAGLYTVPDDVVLTGADANRHGVMITWQPAAYAQSYRVYRRVDGGKWEVLADRVSSTGYCDETFEQGQAYYYTVRALNRTKISRGYDRVGVTATTYYFGTCGDNLSWDMDPEEGMLTIFNTEHGTPCRMTDYDDASPAPWYAAREKVRTVGMYIDQDCALTIGTNAFAGCTALKRIDMLPAGLTAIGKGAFTGCTALTDVYYGDDGHAWEQVTGSENALPAQTKLHTKGNLYESGTLSNGLRWELALTEKSGLLTIKGSGAMPDFPNGARTTDWYPYRDKVTVAIVSHGITSVGANAFRDSAALDLMSIAGSVTSVGDNAFRGCSALRKIKFRGKGVDWDAAIAGADTGIPSTTVVEYLNGAYDSGSCGQDLTWTLSPDGVLTISGTGSMPDYSMKYANTTDYTWISTAPCAAHADRIQRLVMEEGVTSASKYAFCGLTALTAVTLPDSLSTIGWGTFEDCSGLTGITIPSGVTAIGTSAFEGCKALTAIDLPDSLTALGASAFKSCSALRRAGIGRLTDISDSLFEGCAALETVSSGTFKTVGQRAFYGCAALAFPANSYGTDKLTYVQTIGANAFTGCKGLTSVKFNNLTALGEGVFADSGLRVADLRYTSITAIPKQAFQNCPLLVAMLGEDVTAIEQSAFSGCTQLKSIYIPAALTSLSYPSFPDSSAMAQQLHVFFGGTRSAWEKVTSYSVGTTALSNVCLVAGYSFPWGNNYDWSFSTDATLTIGTMSGGGSRYAAPWAVYMPAVEKGVVKEGVKAVGYEAFAADAWSLTSVSLPDSLTLIALDAFNGCTALTEIALPSGVTEIQRNAFYGCKTLKRISIPAAVTAIGDDTFYNTALSDVYYGGTEEQWSAITIGSSNQRLTNAARHYNSPSF